MTNNVFAPIKPKKISEEIVKQLRSLIFEGKLRPGEKLPPERELANSLNVSRPPLREALTTLQQMGLIEIQHGNRTFVRPITTRSIFDPLVSFYKESPENILQIHELRKIIEVGIVSLAAERATPEQTDNLKQIIEQMEKDISKNRLGAKSDLDFHFEIALAANNQALIHLINTIYDLLQEELRIAWGTTFQDIKSRHALFQQHLEIFNAIEKHSPQKARIAARKHLEYVGRKWEESISFKKYNSIKGGEE